MKKFKVVLSNNLKGAAQKRMKLFVFADSERSAKAKAVSSVRYLPYTPVIVECREI